MSERDLGSINVAGLDLEPLEPFLDDVFAGLDDHPPGLWHPTLLEASAPQQNANAGDVTALDPAEDQQANEQQTQPPSLDLGLHEAVEPVAEQLQIAAEEPHTLHLEGHSLVDQLQQQQHSAIHDFPHNSNTEAGLQYSQHAMVPLAAGSAPVEDMQCSHSSSTLSPVAAADELTASSNSLQLDLAAPSLAVQSSAIAFASPLSSLDVQPGNYEAHDSSRDNAASGEYHLAGPSPAGAPVRGTVAIADADASSDSSSSSSVTVEPDSPHRSVPDIDEVSEEQQQSLHETDSPAVPPAAAGLVQDDEQQQQQQWSLEDEQLQLQQAVGLVKGSSGVLHGQQQQQEWQQQQPEQYQKLQQAEQEDISPSLPAISNLAGHGTEDGQAAAWHGAAEAAEPAGLQRLGDGHTAEAATPDTTVADAASAAEDEAVGSGEFVSPSTSWHSCMTQASHVATHSVMSAASFATARGLSALTVAARLVEQQPAQVQQQQQQQITAGGASKGLMVAIAGDAAVYSAAMPAASNLECNTAGAAAGAPGFDCGTSPSGEQGGFMDTLGVPSLPAGQQQEQPPNEPSKQQLQQQQWQQEYWQDVSPPSLGSSPPTPSGYTTVHPMHMHEVTPAATAEEVTPPKAGSAVVSTTAAPDSGDCATDGGHGQYYSVHPSVQLPGDLRSAAQRHAPAAAGGLQPQQHYTGAGRYPFNASIANSSYMLRQSELVDLSLSTSVHPSQQQHFRPGWLTAHQHLPPAAAQAVERAVCALNDSYFFHERLGQSQGPVQQHGQQQQGLMPEGGMGMYSGAPSGGSSKPADGPYSTGSSPPGGLGASGLLGPGLIRRSAGGAPWSHASTQPQQDQQARHRLPSHGTHQAGWARPGILGQWFSNTVQQPLAAAASLAAAGVGQRLAAAGIRTASNATPATAASSDTAKASPADGQGGSSGGAAIWDGELHDAVLVEHTPDLPQSLQEQEDTAFQGLLFLGGRDSHGRPVVIVNTDAVPAGQNSAPRDAALTYLLKKLTPVVSRGPYVLVLVAFHHGPQFRLLPAVWCVRAYHSLPRAFRKNVKHVVLLQPSLMVRTGLALLYPFVSSKAHAKIKQVHRLLDVESATSGEVQVAHLGEAFLTTVQQFSRAQQQAATRQSADGTSRTVPVPGALNN